MNNPRMLEVAIACLCSTPALAFRQTFATRPRARPPATRHIAREPLLQALGRSAMPVGLLALLTGCVLPQQEAARMPLFRDLQRTAADRPARPAIEFSRASAMCRIVARNAANQLHSMAVATGSPRFVIAMRQTYENTFVDCMLARDYRFDGFIPA